MYVLCYTCRGIAAGARGKEAFRAFRSSRVEEIKTIFTHVSRRSYTHAWEIIRFACFSVFARIADYVF